MDKRKLIKFIEKYHLGTNIEAVMWNIKNQTLQTSFQSDDKSVLGEVICKNADGFESVSDAQIGIYTTSILTKLLSVLDNEININFLKVGDKFATMDVMDSVSEINFMLCDTDVIPRVPELKTLPEFNLELKIDSVFINRFIKSKNALPKCESFTIISHDNQINFIIGWSNINSNRAIIKPEVISKNKMSDLKLSFSADFFKEILSVNKDCKEAILKVSSRGLAYIQFDTDDFMSKYFLIAIDLQN